jgi:excisionase family DNA binding protein
MTDRLLTAREVGEFLGLSTESVLRRWRSGELPGFRLASNVLRFDRAEIEAWLALRRSGPRPILGDVRD